MKLIQSFKQRLLHEASVKSLSRIWQHTNESNIGMITAYRGELDLKKNEIRNKDLAVLIRQAGFGYIQVTGFYIENLGQDDERKVQEKSFLVMSSANDSGKLRDFLIKMGIKFNQDSIFYKDATKDKGVLIGTASGRWPGLNTEVVAGRFTPQKLGTYYTKMKGDRKFTFESVECPQGLMPRALQEKLKNS